MKESLEPEMQQVKKPEKTEDSGREGILKEHERKEAFQESTEIVEHVLRRACTWTAADQ